MPSRWFARNAGLAALIVAVAWLGRLALPGAPENAVVYPAAGVALAALVLAGPVLAPGVALGAGLDALATGHPPAAAVLLAIGAAVAALTGALLLRRLWDFSPGFGRVSDAVGFLLLGALAAPTVAALFAVAAAQLTGERGPAIAIWWPRWTGDLFGALIAAPLILTWLAPAPPRYPRSARRAELPLEATILAAVAWFTFVGDLGPAGILIVGVAFLAVRHGVRGGALGVAIVSAVGLWAAYNRHSVALPVSEVGEAQVQGYLLVISAISLLAGTAISEHEATAARLHEANEYERALKDASPVAVVAVDLQGKVLTWNSAAERIFGYTPAEVLGQPLPYVPEERSEEYERLRELHMQGRSLTGFETLRRRKDGSLVEVRLSLAPLRNAAGELAGSMGTLEDLTERRHTREAGERLAAILEATTDLVAMTDPQGRMVYLNAGGRRMLGLAPQDDIVGRLLQDFHPPWAARRVAEHGIPCALRDGQWSGETAVLGPGGEEIPVLQLIQAHSDGRGEPQYLSTIVRDIRAQKAAERALLARNELLEKVFDSSPLMITLFDPNGRIAWVNRPWERTLGWTLAEAQGRDIVAELYPDPEYRAQVEEFVRRSDGIWQDFQTRVRDGRTITTSWINVRLSDGTLIGLGQDVGAQRALEEQLRHSQKMEAVGQLAGGVAHDFNNVLTSIIGYTESLLDQVQPGSPLHADAAEIKRAADRAAALTRQLLTFSRKQLVEPTVIDLNRTVVSIATMLRRLLGGSIELRTELAQGLARIKADAGQIDQVIVNLAVNARDAMPAGGTLTIRTANVVLDRTYGAVQVGVPPGRYVALVLSDTGVGMEEAVRARIFEPFFTTKDKAKGTGLGLAMVYAIVRQAGGSVEVWSAPGQGSVFTVYLPQVEEPVATGTAAPSESPAAADGAETVLVVEDEESVRQLATRTLRRMGYQVLEAANADRALELSRGHAGTIHLVLSDVMMTGRTGPQLVAALRAERNDFRVLYVSGYPDGLVLDATADASADFLPKPFTPRRLAAKVREVLDA